MASLLALGYSMLVQPQETDEKTGADTPAVDDNTSKPDTRTPTPDPKHSVSTKSLPNPPSSFKGLPKLPDGESSRTPSRRPSFRRSSTKADADSESTRKGPSKESKRNKMHASAKELDDQYAKQMAKVAKLMRKMARAEQREKNARWKAAMQDITLAREAGLDPQKDKVGWDEDSEDEAAPAPRDDALKKPFTDLSTKPAGEDTPAPESGDALARFIHAMFSSVNPFEEAFVESKDDDIEPAATASQSAQAQSSTSTKDPKDAQADAEVLRMLSSASTMNQPSQNRRSVWNVLDRLTPGRPKKSGAGEEGSVMLSAPLFVTANSKVTVAQSEMQTIEEHESDTEDAKPNSSKFANLVARMGMDGMFGKKKREKEDSEAEKVEEPEMVIVESEQPKTKEVRVWRPSADGISLQCSWWGYRIYLPPAVIAVLNDQTLEAANRASIVTSALQWIIDNVPVAALGPQVGLVMSLIRGIIPAMGYIGGFVAWSWNTIVGFDQGDGVVLSATWLLPIALIPSAWDIEPVGMPTKAIEAGSTPEATLEPVPEPIPEIKSEPKPKSRSKSKSKPEPQPEPEVETMTAKPSHSRSASMARSMPTLERKASVKSSSTSSKEKKAERRVLERSTTTPVPIPNRPPHPPRQPTLAGPLPTPPSSLPRSSSSIKTHSRSHSQTRPQPHSRSQSQSYAPTPPVTKVKEPKPESDRHTLKRSTSKLGMNIVWSDKPVSEEPKEEVETESMKMRQFKLPMPDITWEHERKAAEAEAAAKYAEEQRIRMAEEEARKAKLKNKYAQALREEMAKDKPSPAVGWSLLS